MLGLGLQLMALISAFDLGEPKGICLWLCKGDYKEEIDTCSSV